jgi:hypothetical protein
VPASQYKEIDLGKKLKDEEINNTYIDKKLASKLLMQDSQGFEFGQKSANLFSKLIPNIPLVKTKNGLNKRHYVHSFDVMKAGAKNIQEEN